MLSCPLRQEEENITFGHAYRENIMSHNLALLSQEEKDKVNVDLAAAGVAFKERYNMPVVAEMIANEQPEALREWFRQRLMHYRQASLNLSRLPYEPKQK
ncbi:DNA polymerase-3 subunit theta [Pantoea sp. AG702]|nr:DNA polymerase-3 subunit theta [Pantoea sp. AG702]